MPWDTQSQNDDGKVLVNSGYSFDNKSDTTVFIITDSDDKAAALSSDDLSDTDSTDIMPANENVLSETEDVIDLPKTDDLDSIKSYLNDYNGHRLARNSSLLTSYDRFGRLVEPGVSDKDKILRGDSESLMNQLRRKK